MSRKQRAPQFKVVDNVDGQTSFLSAETSIKMLDTVLYTVEIDSALNTTLEIEVSNDLDTVAAAERTYRKLDMGQTLTLDGPTETQYQILLRDCPFCFVRLSFTANSGTGNINAWINGVSKGA